MSIDFTLSVITFCIVTILSLVVFFHNQRSWTNRLFLILSIIINAYIVVNYFSLHPPQAGTQLFWIRVVMCITSFIGPALVIFVHTFPNEHITLRPKYILFLILLALSSALFSLSNYVFSAIEYPGGAPLPIPGPAIAIFLVDFVGLFIFSYIILVHKFILAQDLLRLRIRLLLIGACITFSLMGLTTVVLVVFARTSSTVFLGPTFASIFMLVLAYAIVRYRFFDIHVKIQKLHAQIAVLIFSVLVYGIFYVSLYIVTQSIAVLIVGPLLLFLLGRHYTRWLLKIIDGIFFKNDFDFSRSLSADAAKLDSEFQLTTYVLDLVSRIQLKVKTYVDAVYVVQRQHNRLWSYYPRNSRHTISCSEPLFDEIRQSDSVAFLVDDQLHRNRVLHNFMRKRQAELLLVVRDGSVITACFFLLAKGDGNRYSEKEITELTKMISSAGRSLEEHIYWYETVEGLKRKLNNDIFEV